MSANSVAVLSYSTIRPDDISMCASSIGKIFEKSGLVKRLPYTCEVDSFTGFIRFNINNKDSRYVICKIDRNSMAKKIISDYLLLLKEGFQDLIDKKIVPDGSPNYFKDEYLELISLSPQIANGVNYSWKAVYQVPLNAVKQIIDNQIKVTRKSILAGEFVEFLFTESMVLKMNYFHLPVKSSVKAKLELPTINNEDRKAIRFPFEHAWNLVYNRVGIDKLLPFFLCEEGDLPAIADPSNILIESDLETNKKRVYV